MALKFPQQQTQLLRKTREPGGRAKDLQFALFLQQQRAQHHHPAFLAQRGRRRAAQVAEDKFRQALERKDVQPRVTKKMVGRDSRRAIPRLRKRLARTLAPPEQLAFELKRGLLGSEENQRRTVGGGAQGGADFRQTAERLAAASGAEEKARLHEGKCSRKAGRAERNLFFSLDRFCPGVTDGQAKPSSFSTNLFAGGTHTNFQ